MKKPSMLMGALLLGLPAAALAGTSCTGTVISACGLQIVKSVCDPSTSKTDDDPDEQYEHHLISSGSSVRTQSADIDHTDGKNTYRQDDDISPSHYSGQEKSYDFTYTDPHGNIHHVDHSERLGTSPDGKVTICHRMGGARVTLDVPDDQFDGVKAHGHGDHDLDTLGRCEDQEDASGNDDPAKIAAATKLSQKSSVTSSLAACLSAPAGTNLTVSLSGGTTWTGSAPGCNAPGVFCTVPVGGAAGGAPNFSSGPNRGGVRSLR